MQMLRVCINGRYGYCQQISVSLITSVFHNMQCSILSWQSTHVLNVEICNSKYGAQYILLSKSPVLSHWNQKNNRPIMSFSLVHVHGSILQQMAGICLGSACFRCLC